MKKSKKVGLSLNKKVISNFESSSIKGGTWASASPPCYTGDGSGVHCLTGSWCKCK